MLFTQGGFTAGWGFYVQDNKLVAVHNFLGRQRYRIVSAAPVPTGKSTLKIDFLYDGDRLGKGETIKLSANDKPLGEGRADRTVQGQYSAFEGYRNGYRFAGRRQLRPAVSIQRNHRQSRRGVEVNPQTVQGALRA
jgi:hypothetical protein